MNTITKTIKLEISMPVEATVNAHADVDLDIDPGEAVKAVLAAINRSDEEIRLLMLAESERQAREWRWDQQIEECLNRR
jgi:hypothetical protein